MNMRRRLSVLGAAATIGCCALTFNTLAQDMAGDRVATPAPSTRPADRATAQAPDAEDIRGALAKTTEDALSKNSFSNFYGHFVDADRNRISAGEKNITRAEWDKLNGRLESFHKNWKLKYNQDFDVDKERMVFNDQFRIVQGEIGEAQPAAGRIPGATPDTTRTRDPGAPNTTPGPESEKVAGGDTNREPGRNVAKVTFPASHGLPEAFVPVIHEMPDSWKLDVPDQVDARRLYDNLLKHATMLDEHRDRWPADVNDAYRMAAHHVTLAALDVDASSAAGGMIKEGAKALDRATGDR
jgi:hypothetical protein